MLLFLFFIDGKGQQCDPRLKAKHIDRMPTSSQDNSYYHIVDTNVKASEDSYFEICYFLLYFEVMFEGSHTSYVDEILVQCYKIDHY